LQGMIFDSPTWYHTNGQQHTHDQLSNNLCLYSAKALELSRRGRHRLNHECNRLKPK